LSLRPQQVKLDIICKNIKNSSPVNEIFLYWVPGSGKSLVAPIVSQLIDDSNIKILWIVPRDSLKTQAESDFRGSGHFNVGDKDIRIADNAGDPFRSLCGAVTTYQAIAADPQKWIDISIRYKLILILDEYDSLTDYSSWSIPISEMYNNSILRIPMTGTIDRSDRQKISFVNYIDNEIDFSETDTKKWIIYDNDQALKDRSILPFESILVGGSGSYIDKEGNQVEFDKFDGDSNQLRCAFATDYVYTLFGITLNHWKIYREYHSWSKLLVVAADIKIAKIYLNWFKKQGYRIDIATSESPLEAKEAIRRVKLPNTNHKALDCLISVAMIYKGMNIRECTHLAFTTIVRGSAWVEQALGRVRRCYNEKQEGFLFAPDDPKLLSVLRKINGGKIYLADGKSNIPIPKKPGNGSAEEIEALNSKAHTNFVLQDPPSIPYSEKEKLLRTEMNFIINSYISEKSKKMIDGELKFVHTESLRRRKILWYKIYAKIGRRCQLKEMTYEEMEIAKTMIEDLCK